MLNKAQGAQLILTRWKRQARLGVVMKPAPVTSGLRGIEQGKWRGGKVEHYLFSELVQAQ